MHENMFEAHEVTLYKFFGIVLRRIPLIIIF